MDDETDGDRTAQSREIIENTPAGGNTGAVVTAADPNGAGDILTHALGGPDAGSFTNDPGTGRLKTKAARDLEGRETCTVEVTATDSSNAAATAEVTIKVTDEDEAPESMARRAWPGEHGPESMARRAWPGEHGPESMARRAWPGEHGPESMEGDLAMSGSSGVPYDENGTADAALAPWTLDGDAAGDFSNNAGMLTFSSSPD